jgi:hypothetical protein
LPARRGIVAATTSIVTTAAAIVAGTAAAGEAVTGSPGKRDAIGDAARQQDRARRSAKQNFQSG